MPGSPNPCPTGREPLHAIGSDREFEPLSKRSRDKVPGVSERRPRILVVDDESDLRDILQEFLEGYGCDADTVGSAVAALQAVRERRPDVILLDLQMPGPVDGSAVLRSVGRRVPVVIVSGNADVELARAMLKEGAFDYVTKPIDFARLWSTIEAALAYGEEQRQE